MRSGTLPLRSRPCRGLGLVLGIAAVCACGGGLDSGNNPNLLPPWTDAGPNPNAFWQDDPPPQFCVPDGVSTPTPTPPGGTVECPDDKNREGCPCPSPGVSASCWPGLRVHRNRGICRDGTTTCVMHGELNRTWGPCEGYVLPKPGVALGPEACACFSEGKWELQNLSPCLLTYPDGQVWAVSSYLANGDALCPQAVKDQAPQPEPGQPWSANTLTVDCAGQFRLCYTIKAGKFSDPQPTDCIVAETCTEVWYEQENVPQQLSALPGWVSSDSDCVARFKDYGGYGEMSVQGLSIQCESIDDGGSPLVFKRLSYCSVNCAANPTLPYCQGCGNDGDGTF